LKIKPPKNFKGYDEDAFNEDYEDEEDEDGTARVFSMIMPKCASINALFVVLTLTQRNSRAT